VRDEKRKFRTKITKHAGNVATYNRSGTKEIIQCLQIGGQKKIKKPFSRPQMAIEKAEEEGRRTGRKKKKKRKETKLD